MTNCAPLRAGTPKLSAAGPDRNVTTPSLKVSCADAGPARASDVAAIDAAKTARLDRQARSMISSADVGGFSRLVIRAVCPGIGRHWREFRQAFTARLYAPGLDGGWPILAL